MISGPSGGLQLCHYTDWAIPTVFSDTKLTGMNTQQNDRPEDSRPLLNAIYSQSAQPILQPAPHSSTWPLSWSFSYSSIHHFLFLNRLTPNDLYISRTAPLISKRCILYIYSTNICTEYFKHALHSPFFFSSKCSLFHNANLFGSVLFTFYIQGVLKLKKNNSGAKRLIIRTFSELSVWKPLA